MPDVDLKPLDLLDQDHDRLARRPELLTAVSRKAGAPRPENLEPLLVQALAHPGSLLDGARLRGMTSSPRAGGSTTGETTGRSLSRRSWPRGSDL